jgi:hypothetical protein
VGGNVHVDSKAFLVIDFVNLKNKPAQFSEVLIRVRCVYMYL